MLSAEQLEGLRKFSSPTISNAVEMFDIRPRNEGFVGPEVKCLFPGLGRMTLTEQNFRKWTTLEPNAT